MHNKYFVKNDEETGLPIYDDLIAFTRTNSGVSFYCTENGVKGVDEGINIRLSVRDTALVVPLSIDEARKLRDWLNRRVE